MAPSAAISPVLAEPTDMFTAACTLISCGVCERVTLALPTSYPPSDSALIEPVRVVEGTPPTSLNSPAIDTDVPAIDSWVLPPTDTLPFWLEAFTAICRSKPARSSWPLPVKAKLPLLWNSPAIDTSSLELCGESLRVVASCAYATPLILPTDTEPPAENGPMLMATLSAAKEKSPACAVTIWPWAFCTCSWQPSW